MRQEQYNARLKQDTSLHFPDRPITFSSFVISGEKKKMTYDKEDRCGIFPLAWKNDSFHHACVLHDVLYVARKKGDVTYGRREVDTIFKNQMLNIAGNNILLKTKAYLYWGIARIAGGFFWRRGHEK